MSIDSYYTIAGLNIRVSNCVNLIGFSEFEVDSLTDVDIDIICDCEGVVADVITDAHELNNIVIDGCNHIFSRYETGFVFTLRGRIQPSVSLRYELGSNVVEIESCGDLQMLRFMLWVAFSMAALGRGVVPIHSSVVVCDQTAILFLGDSGAGKSTQSRLWIEHIKGCKLLNDDSPILRFEGGKLMVYGSPWSGKTPCYINESYSVEAFVRVVKFDGDCTIAMGDVINSFTAIYPSLPPMFANDESMSDILITFASNILSAAPIFTLHCPPDSIAAHVTHNKIYGNRDRV